MIDNALKYGPADSSIDVAVARHHWRGSGHYAGTSPECSTVSTVSTKVDRARWGHWTAGSDVQRRRQSRPVDESRFSDCLRRLVDRAAM